MLKVVNNVRVTGPDGRVFKGPQALDLLFNSRQKIGPARFYLKPNNEPLSKALFSIYSRLSNLVDRAVVENLGGTIIKGKAGSGVIPDFITYDEEGEVDVSEGKAISTRVDASGQVTRAREIGVAGGKGINLRRTSRLLTGFSTDATGAARAVEEDVSFSKSFLSQLLALKNDNSGLKAFLNKSRSPAAIALRKNFELKSANIRVPIQVGNRRIVKSIGWSWKQISRNPKAKIKVTEGKKGEVFFQIYFTEAEVRKSLNNANARLDVELKKISSQLARDLAAEFAQFSPQVIQFLNSQMKGQFVIEYDKGSALLGRGSIVAKTKRKKAATRLKVISDIQLTALVQQETERRMPRGPKRGEPLSPTVLTYRTGQFVESIKVMQNIRSNIIKYYYAPNYRVHEKRGARAPRFLLQGSIRDVVKRVYGERFRIIRGF